LQAPDALGKSPMKGAMPMVRQRRRHPRRSGKVSHPAPSSLPASVTAVKRENLFATLALPTMVLIAFFPAFFADFVERDVTLSAAEALLEWSGLLRL